MLFARPDRVIHVMLVASMASVGAALAAGDGRPSSSPPLALNPHRAMTQYVRTVWQRAEGLPQNTVSDILQTRDGYLWAATQDGLVRFDGARFTVFNTSTDPA